MLLVKSEYCSYYIIFPNKELQRLKLFKNYCWKVIYEHISTFWHTAALNTCLVKRKHKGKQGLSDQSQYTACIVVKVMFFEAQINSWRSTRSWITFPSIISCHLMEPSMTWFISEISYRWMWYTKYNMIIWPWSLLITSWYDKQILKELGHHWKKKNKQTHPIIWIGKCLKELFYIVSTQHLSKHGSIHWK